MAGGKVMTLRMPEELFARVEQARGGLPREVWVRDALERVLAGLGPSDLPPAPAGANVPQLAPVPVADGAVASLFARTSSGQAKSGIRPVPKK